MIPLKSTFMTILILVCFACFEQRAKKKYLKNYIADSTDWEVLEAGFRAEAEPPQNSRVFDLWKSKEEEDLINKERVVVAEGIAQEKKKGNLFLL